MTRRQNNGFLISRLTRLRFIQFLRRRVRGHGILKEIHSPAGHIYDSSDYVRRRDLYAAAIVEREFGVVRLHSYRRHNATVVKLKEAKAGFEVQWIVFNLWRSRECPTEWITFRGRRRRIEDRN